MEETKWSKPSDTLLVAMHESGIGPFRPSWRVSATFYIAVREAGYGP
jgi:hypothetical protein